MIINFMPPAPVSLIFKHCWKHSDSIEHLPFTKSLLIRANTLRNNIDKEYIRLRPTINREIAFLNRDIKEHLRLKKHSISPKF
jgi:hypothetical protein